MSSAVQELTELFEREQHDAKVTKASEVPTSYAAITAEWLTDVICRDAPGAAVVDFRFDERDDGSSNRRRIFLTYNDAGRAAGLPATVFCKAAEALLNRMVLGFSGASQNEMDFYNKVRGRLDMEAPVGIYANLNPVNFASLIMLHDLGGSVEFCDDRTDIMWDRAVSQLDTLSRLHSRFYESSELGSSTVPFRTWPKWWRDMMVASPEFGASCDKAFGDSEALMSPELFRQRDRIWPLTQMSVDRHEQLPRTLIHCDVHLKNWYIAKNGAMGLSDWQIASVGHWSRDLVYTMTTALTVENRRKWERDLVKVYLEKMAERGVPRVSEDEAWKNLRQQLFTALAFWTITLVPAPGMPDMQPERTTKEFLRRLLTAISDHEALKSFD
jgi:hypothetical protein